MNTLEQDNLMFFMAKPEIFTEVYNVHEQGMMLESGDVFIHAGKCGTMAITAKYDDRVLGFTHEGMMAYIEYVDGYKGGEDGV